jgi:hypothetical protein
MISTIVPALSAALIEAVLYGLICAEANRSPFGPSSMLRLQALCAALWSNRVRHLILVDPKGADRSHLLNDVKMGSLPG